MVGGWGFAADLTGKGISFRNKVDNTAARFRYRSEGYPLARTSSNRVLSCPLHRSGWQPNRSSNADAGDGVLFAQDYAQEATINRQPTVALVIDKAQRPEFVHEMANPRPGGADHLGQVILINSGMNSFGPTLLAKMRQQ